jgi:hypothetical protein
MTKIDTTFYFTIHIMKFFSMWYKKTLQEHLGQFDLHYSQAWHIFIINYIIRLQFRNNLRNLQFKRVWIWIIILCNSRIERCCTQLIWRWVSSWGLTHFDIAHSLNLSKYWKYPHQEKK